MSLHTGLQRLVFSSRVGRRILLMFLIGALVPVGLGGLLTFDITERQIEAQSHDTLRRSTKSAGLWLYDRLLAVEDVLHIIASSTAKPGAIADSYSQLSQTEFTSRLLALTVHKPHGTSKNVLGPTISKPRFSAQQQQHLDKGRTVLKVIAGPGGRAQITFSLQRQSDASTQPVLYTAEPHPDFIWRFNEDPNTTLCVTTRELSYLHCPQPLSDVSAERLLTAQEHAISGHLDHSDSSRDQHAYYWSLFLNGHFAAPSWVVLGRNGTSNGGAEIRDLFLTVFPGVLLLTVLLVLLLSLIQIRRFTEPLDRLTAATQRLGAGIFDTRIEIRSGDEFEQLGSAFNSMTDSLNETISTLKGFADIDQIILTASNEEEVLRAVASNLPTLTNCRYGALVTLPIDDRPGRIRLSSNQLPGLSEQEAVAIDSLSITAIEARPDYAVLEHQDTVPPCLGAIHGAPGTGTVWQPFTVKGGRRGVLVCVFDDNDLTPLRQQRVKDLSQRLVVALADAKKAEVLYRQANFDALTGLANRNRMNAMLESAINQADTNGSSVALLFIDLDRFKSINDTLGHTHGDDFLRQVADRLTAVVPKETTVARFGGDEFICLAPCEGDDPPVRARDIARAIMLAITRPFDLANRELTVTLSMGIAMYPQDGDTSLELLKNADIALYHAKASGKDTWQFFTPEFTSDATRRMEIELALREALANERLKLAYQPQIDPDSGEVHGVEALLRWPNCPLGRIGPADFIPIAEESRLIIDIGAWVIREACHQLCLWREEGIDGLTMSVNLSPRHFLNPGLPVQIAEALRQNDLEPNLFEVEITESSMMEDIDATSKVLANLRTLGIKVAIDDFGTGHSSLEYLVQLPVDTLKIDQVFIRDAIINNKTEAIVETVIDLAHRLDMKVVAEGVETNDHLTLLASKGCDLMQGYTFARPLSADDFALWWNRHYANWTSKSQAVAMVRSG